MCWLGDLAKRLMGAKILYWPKGRMVKFMEEKFTEVQLNTWLLCLLQGVPKLRISEIWVNIRGNNDLYFSWLYAFPYLSTYGLCWRWSRVQEGFLGLVWLVLCSQLLFNLPDFEELCTLCVFKKKPKKQVRLGI